MREHIERVVSRTVLRLPAALLLRLIGSEPRVVAGQTLDPQIQFGLALEERRDPTPVYEQSPEDARRSVAARFAILDVDPEPVDSVRDWMSAVDGREPVPVRVYRPRGCGGGMLVFFHGGGGVIGSVDAYDAICRHVANRAGVVLVSVDYRLAPEHPFPAGIDDAVTAYLWARSHAARLGADPERVAVGGDSMGGNFAAGVCLRCQGEGLPLPRYQWLIYPATDFTRAQPSHQTCGHGFVLDAPLIHWFTNQYLAGHDPRDPATSPLFAADVSGLPPALLVTAGFDPLRDEGSAYADRLRDAGCEVSYVCERGLVHGFLQMGGAVREARRAIDAAADVLAAAI